MTKGDALEIKVLITREKDAWVAEGLDIYFVAQGSSLEEAKANFIHGLVETIRINVQRFGTWREIVRPAPAELWREFHEAIENLTVTHESFSGLPRHIPYGVIAYVQSQRNAERRA